MRKLFHNCKGAVTVMVTLLLIPAILVSGTGVDLARVYATRSILQDANQLAANSVLASYEALLQDLYGLYGVLNDGDYETDKYVKWAVEGDSWNKGMGTFQIFYGSNLNPAVLTPAADQNLGNSAVLRRQIEEYAKFRAPAIISELLMDKLEVFEKIQEDAKVIKKKMEVDDGVEELEKYYKKIYDHVQKLESCGVREEAIMKDVSDTADRIRALLREMQGFKEVYRQAKAAYDSAKSTYESSEDPDERAAAKDIMDEMEARMLETRLYYLDRWGNVQDASKALRSRVEVRNGYADELKDFMDEVDKLLTDCKTAEAKKEDLREKIEELRSALEHGNCTKTLKDGLTKPEEGSSLSVLEQYEALLKYDIAGMGQAMHDHDIPQIDGTLKDLRASKLGPFELMCLQSMNMDSYFPLDPDSSDSFPEVVNASTKHEPFKVNGKAFLRFEEVKTPESKNFWDELRKLYSDNETGAKKDKLEKAVSSIFKKAQSVFKELAKGASFTPEGAEYLSGGTNDSGSTTGSKFGTGNDWKNKDEGKKEMEDSLDGDFLQKLANTAKEAGNKLLLLVYDTEMFSDYSTPGQDESGYPEENMAGIPLSIDVNYYFQSELEYLYNGNLADAKDNLTSVAGMLFLVRFVLNYVASFSVSGVNSVVRQVKAALSWSGPFAILAGELTRLGLALGESAIDVARLRAGDQVAVFKNSDNWKLSISGLTKAATEGVSDAALDAAFNTDQYKGNDTATGGDEGVTLGYTDYMRLFLLLVPGDTLASRTRNLIELNVTNYKNHIDADEGEMAGAERYDLSKLFTGFELTTTVDLRMLFLSMALAQEAIDGVAPPKTLPVSVTDYRGY